MKMNLIKMFFLKYILFNFVSDVKSIKNCGLLKIHFMNSDKNIPNVLNIKPTNIKPTAGKLLISEPFLPDIYFRRSVVLLIDHSDEGTIGIVLNKPVHVKISDVVDDFVNVDLPLYSGGPIDVENIFFIHRINDYITSSEKIVDNIFWGGDKDEVAMYLKSSFFSSKDVRAFLGYSGWEPGQLSEELKKGSWIVSNLNANIIFNTNPEDLWKAVVANLGENYKHWLNFPQNYLMN